MTLQEFIIKWDNSWTYDYWWRQKYHIAFNSEQHRNANQIDIAFEYFEHQLSQKAIEKNLENKENKKLFKEGKWIKESVADKAKEDKLFDKMDLSNF